jgi:hypothetical protein
MQHALIYNNSDQLSSFLLHLVGHYGWMDMTAGRGGGLFAGWPLPELGGDNEVLYPVNPLFCDAEEFLRTGARVGSKGG